MKIRYQKLKNEYKIHVDLTIFLILNDLNEILFFLILLVIYFQMPITQSYIISQLHTIVTDHNNDSFVTERKHIL